MPAKADIQQGFAERLATILGVSSEGGVVEGNVIADEGVGETDHAARDQIFLDGAVFLI
jgi:hypothetical protein